MTTIYRVLIILVVAATAAILVYGSTSYDPQKKSRQAYPAFETIVTNAGGKGLEIQIEFVRGKFHNHPLLAVWLEDMEGNYIQTLYVAKSIATGVFQRGKPEWQHWAEGEVRRPAALPYWGHKRGVKAADGLYVPDKTTQVPDAYSGATPKGDFILQTKPDQPVSKPFRVLLEINQPWDWNQYWTNNKFPDDPEYKTSSQPAVVYEAIIDPNVKGKTEMKPIGHSHYSGKDGTLTSDLSTLTTALQIAGRITVIVQ